jgi:N-carbamoylputrescine amidase
MKLYLVQMHPEPGDTGANLAKIIDWVDRGLAAGADLIVFGECAREGYDLSGKLDYDALAETIPGPATEEIRRHLLGRKTLVCCGMAERVRDDVYNAAPLIGADGVIGVARKLYLVHLHTDSGKLVAEDLFFKPGQRIRYFDTDFGRIGVQICLDNLHPEISYAQAIAGCWLRLRPSAGPNRPGRPPLMPVDLVRAQENQTCDAYVNLVGDQGGVWYRGGSSVILGGKGVQIQASVGPDAVEEALEYEVTPADVHRARGGFNYVRDVRPELLRQAWEIAREYQYGEDR